MRKNTIAPGIFRLNHIIVGSHQQLVEQIRNSGGAKRLALEPHADGQLDFALSPGEGLRFNTLANFFCQQLRFLTG